MPCVSSSVYQCGISVCCCTEKTSFLFGKCIRYHPPISAFYTFFCHFLSDVFPFGNSRGSNIKQRFIAEVRISSVSSKALIVLVPYLVIYSLMEKVTQMEVQKA